MADQHLETEAAENPIWLVKVPKFLAARWAKAAEEGGPGAVLGAMSASGGAGSLQQVAPVSFKLPAAAAAAEGLPAEYQVVALSGGGQGDTHVFSNSEEDGHCSITGKVAQRFEFRPQRNMEAKNAWETKWGKVDIDPKYCKLSRARYETATHKTRKMQTIDDPRGRMVHLPKYSGKRPSEAPRGQRPSDLKRVRMDKDSLEKLLFRCFERKPFWGFSELVEETDQPSVWLKEVLLEVAVLNKSGDNKMKYQLKPEYQV
mmetsp:Transcript_7824/g.20201  ORF Transcript_7824/g.20201 Transcript_7824/m.20201 type:complete len:259 (-) Transcript_7824:234-1010(-)|eukprot:jgi/Tetstr1/422413/TSEL_013251.t1